MAAQKRRTQLLHKNDIHVQKKAYIWSAWTGILLASHECIPFSKSSASKISVGLQYRCEYQISTHRPIGKTKTTHKSNKTITGLESRAGLSTRYSKRNSCSEKAEHGPIWFQVCNKQLRRGKGQLFSRSTMIK